MKKHFQITALAAAFVACLSSCSSDEPALDTRNPLLPDSDYDSRALTEMLSPSTSITLTRDKIESYRKDAQTNGEWELYDWTEYIGGSVPGPRFMSVMDGKIYTEITRWSSAYGPTHFSTALGLLIQKKVVNRDWPVLISREYELTESSITVDGNLLNIKNIKEQTMWVSIVEEYWGGRTGEGGHHLYLMSYNMGDQIENAYRFDTIEEAYTWVIGLFREHFGEEVNLNHYTDGMAILDRPMFDAGMIEAELQGYKDKTISIRL